jgi:hypothetical protein
METASLVISVIAVVFAGGAVWYARGEKLAAADSAREAKRSADAAHEAVGYQRDEVERNRIVFRLDPVSGEKYLLRNAGTHSAYGVHVDAGDLGFENDVTDYDAFESGRAEPYMFARTLGSTSSGIVVTWHNLADRSGERRQARFPVV